MISQTLYDDDSLVDGYQAQTPGDIGERMGPKSTYRSASLSPADKKASSNFFPQNKKAFSSYPEVNEGVLRIWDLRYFKVGGVRVIGWK